MIVYQTNFIDNYHSWRHSTFMCIYFCAEYLKKHIDNIIVPMYIDYRLISIYYAEKIMIPMIFKPLTQLFIDYKTSYMDNYYFTTYQLSINLLIATNQLKLVIPTL